MKYEEEKLYNPRHRFGQGFPYSMFILYKKCILNIFAQQQNVIHFKYAGSRFMFNQPRGSETIQKS